MQFFRTILMIAALVLIASPSVARDEIQVSGSLSVDMLTEYLGANGVIFHDEPVLQTDLFVLITLGLPIDVYIDIWWSSDFDGDLSGSYGDEVDWTAGILGKVPWVPGSIDFGVSVFDTYDLFKSGGPMGDVIRPYLTLSKGIRLNESHLVTPYTKFEAQLPLRSGIGRGYNLTFGAKHSWQAKPWLSVNSDLSTQYDSGAYGFDRAWIGFAKFSLGWRLREDFLLRAPTLKGSCPMTSVSELDGRSCHGVIGFGITYNFKPITL